MAVYLDTAVVGAPLARDLRGASNGGSFYAFLRTGSTWAQQGPRLGTSDAAADDQFGGSVALYHNTTVVGARLDDASASDQGSAYVFLRTGTHVDAAGQAGGVGSRGE